MKKQKTKAAVTKAAVPEKEQNVAKLQLPERQRAIETPEGRIQIIARGNKQLRYFTAKKYVNGVLTGRYRTDYLTNNEYAIVHNFDTQQWLDFLPNCYKL